MNNILRQKFIENYNMEMVAVELMNLIEEIDMTGEVLENFINEKFGEDFKTHCDNHALPDGFENMDYLEFLSQRRLLMAQIVKKAYNELNK